VAGTADGELRPVLRIDWGSPDEAAAAIAAGGMSLVITSGPADGDRILSGVAVDEAGVATRTRFGQSGRVWAANIRVVDDAPAFAAARQRLGLAGQQRLAVLLPASLQRQMSGAMHGAAIRQGVTFNRVAIFAGRFEPTSAGVQLRVTNVTPRPSSDQ
jgi:hypothetical protein